MKFMHLSDVHLGVEPDAGRPWSKKRAQDIWDSFAEAVKRAGEEQVDFLLISGDLFHSQPLKKELKEINYLFEKIPDTRILLMAGNHDYLQQKSYYRTFQWAENVCFFLREEITSFDFPEKNVCVYGASYWHRELPERLYDEIIPKNPDRINILLAHGGDDRHIPFSPHKIIENGFDYIAAGHIHKGMQLIEGKAVMAGALEPTDCNDTGPHGFWIGEMEKGMRCPKIHFYPIKKCEYIHETICLTSDTTEYELMEQMKKLLADREKYQYFRIILEGRVDPDAVYDFNRIGQMEHVVDVTEHLLPDYSYEKMLEENPGSLLGRYIRTMQVKPQDAVTEKALEFGVSALLGHKICR